MANRHLSRSIVMQSLFEWDFRTDVHQDASEILERNASEFAPGMKDTDFMDTLVRGVIDKKVTLDTIIEKAAPDWPIDKISTVDRNILRLGLFELLYGDRKEVPPKVAINEAIELAKTFGGETSGKFINGVLGAVYKEMGEPGKDEGKEKVDKTKLPLERLVGAVVFAKDGEQIYLGLVHDVFGRWTLCKGHLLLDEDEKTGVIRKAKEELGAEPLSVGEVVGKNEYIAGDPEKGKIRKQVVYFLVEAEYKPLAVGESGGLDDARWFKVNDIEDLTMYDDILPILTEAVSKLPKHNG